MLRIVNNSTAPAHRGGVMIRPGDSRTVMADDLLPTDTRDGLVAYVKCPEHLQQTPVAPEGTDLNALLGLKVGEVVAQLPALGDDELMELDALEQAAKKPRSGILSAIAAERVQRAQNEGGSGTLEEFIESLSTTSDDELNELAELHDDDVEMKTAIAAEQEKRTQT